MALDGEVVDLADPIEQRRQDRVHHPRRPARAGTDPPRCRACAGGSRAVAVARHAGHHRPGDRERLLLRFLPQRAVHAGRFARDRKEDARDHRARQTVHQGGLVARQAKQVFRDKGENFKVELVDAIPGDQNDQDLQAGRLVRSLPRSAHDLDRQGRQRVQADEGRGRVLARRSATIRC